MCWHVLSMFFHSCHGQQTHPFVCSVPAMGLYMCDCTGTVCQLVSAAVEGSRLTVRGMAQDTYSGSYSTVSSTTIQQRDRERGNEEQEGCHIHEHTIYTADILYDCVCVCLSVHFSSPMCCFSVLYHFQHPFQLHKWTHTHLPLPGRMRCHTNSGTHSYTPAHSNFTHTNTHTHSHHPAKDNSL